MITSSSTSCYREMEVLGESPAQLVVRLFSHLSVTLRQAVRHLDAGRRGEMVERLGRAYDVLQELSSSLDLERGDTVAQALDTLYQSYIAMLMDLMKTPDAARLRALIAMADDLLATWESVLKERSA